MFQSALPKQNAAGEDARAPRRSPGSFGEDEGDFAAQVVGNERNGLAFGARQVVTNPDGGVSRDLAIDQDFAGGPLAGGDEGNDRNAVVARCDNVARLKREFRAIKLENSSTKNDVAFTFCIEAKGAVALQAFANGTGHRFA